MTTDSNDLFESVPSNAQLRLYYMFYQGAHANSLSMGKQQAATTADYAIRLCKLSG